jgi:serine/threonine-protein kinase HipA
MAEAVAYAEVRLWGEFVGAAAETEDGQVAFEYDPSFRDLGLEISPLELPLSTQGPVTFPELARLDAFEGLPGLLADALPDRFGNAVIKRYFAGKGRPEDALRPVQKLLYIGDRAMGALEFRPPLAVRRPAERESLEVAELVRQARLVIEGDPEVSIPEMMRVGASAGGARPKALILWNRQANQVRSGFARQRAGDEHWIIKFDAVGELGQPDDRPKPFNRIEYAYSRLAAAAGIEMAETELFEEGGNGHFLTKRFDRDGEGRLHLHSLGGLQHVDFNQPGAYSYEQFLRTILTLGLDYPELEQAYRRAVFNIVAVNQDDHVKNVSFLMDRQGRWRLAPAYDLTFAKGQGYTRLHQMALNDKRDEFTREDLLELGAKMDIRRSGQEVIDEVVEAVSGWPKAAAAARVPRERIESIGRELRLL